VGTVQRILVEGPSRRASPAGAPELMGRTECNRIVNFDGGPQGARLVGRLLDVRITEALPHSLRAVPAGVERTDDAVQQPAFIGAPAQSQTTTG
jgi:tRNA A37 methylthiotransferase MiaB